MRRLIGIVTLCVLSGVLSVLLPSGYAASVNRVAPMRAELPGIHATLPKPFEFSQLLSRVATAVMHGPGPTPSAAAI